MDTGTVSVIAASPKGTAWPLKKKAALQEGRRGNISLLLCCRVTPILKNQPLISNAFFKFFVTTGFGI